MTGQQPLASRLMLAARTLRDEGSNAVPALLAEAAAALTSAVAPSPAPAPASVGSLRITNWPTGPEYSFEPDAGLFELPVGEYRLCPITAETTATKGAT